MTEETAGPDVTFFVPCYNEAENIHGTLDTTVAACRSVGRSFEILVYDDASRDGTSAAVRAYQEAHPDVPLRLFTLTKNRGVASNFVDGAFEGRGRWYRLVCGDNVEPQETHERLLREMGKADIVIPFYTRIRHRPLRRHLISRLYTKLVNVASGYSIRYYNGCPIYLRRDVLRYHVESSGFGYQAELLTRLLHEGRSYREVAVEANDREGSTAITIKNLLSVGHSLFTIAMRRLRIVLFE